MSGMGSCKALDYIRTRTSTVADLVESDFG